MYGVAGEKRPIFLESDAFSYNIDDPNYIHMDPNVLKRSMMSWL